MPFGPSPQLQPFAPHYVAHTRQPPVSVPRMKKTILAAATAAILIGAAPAQACDPRLPTCDPEGTVEDAKWLIGQLTWPIERWLDDHLP